MKSIPNDLIAEVRLNPAGIALYRLHNAPDVSVSEANLLIGLGWAEPNPVTIMFENDAMLYFECLQTTLSGSLEYAEINEFVFSIKKPWGERTEITGLMRALHGSKPLQSGGPDPRRVFSSRLLKPPHVWATLAYFEKNSSKDWFEGTLADYPKEEILAVSPQ